MEEALLEIVRDFCEEVEPEEITVDSKFIDDLDLSSMEIFALVAEIEEEFEIKISERELQTIFTIGDMVKTIASKK